MSPVPTRPIDAAAQLLLIGAIAGALFGIPTARNMLDAQAPAAGDIADAPIVEGDNKGQAVTRAADGLFYAGVRINGTERHCLVDSGATGLVLDAGDARRLGAIGEPRFTGRLITAGGQRAAARVRLASVRIAGHDLRDVPAILVAGSHGPCLLGQDILARLDGLELSGDRLTLR